MKNKTLAGNLILLLGALIWGVAFVFQVEGMDHVPPVTFMAARCFLAAVFLAVLAMIVHKPTNAFRFNRATLKGGILCGLFITVANNLQQIGIQYTTAGKAGFITGLYMLLVPIYGAILFRKKVDFKTWVSVLIGAFGMYLLCIKEGFSIGQGDLYVLLCAVVFAGHIVCAGYYAEDAEPIKMSMLQFAVSFVLSTVWALLFEHPTMAAIWEARVSIAYCGIMSAGIGYTLQIVGQQRTKPEAAAIIMSLESVFAALAGWALLSERMSLRELIGCVLLFAAIILVQVELPLKRRLRPDNQTQDLG